MKRWMAGAAAVVMLSAVALLVLTGATRERGAGPDKWKYMVVRLPANTIDIEFNLKDIGRKSKQTVVTPMDSLGRDGWELVSTVKEGTGYVCFFKMPRAD